MALTQKELTLVAEALQRNFSLDDLERTGWASRYPDQEFRRQLAEIDMEFFCRYYLPHHFDRSPAPMHREIYATIQEAMSASGRQSNAVVWPRGHGKSTTVTCALPLWSVLFRKRRFVVIISDSYPQAKQQLSTVKDELENNERILEDFGPMRGDKWQEDDIVTSNRVKLIALGSGMKIRGRKYLQFRPDLIIGDDLENLEGVRSDTGREKLNDWFFRSVTKAGWSDTKTFVVGNYLHFDCLLKKLTDNPMFKSRVYKAVIDWSTRQDLWDEWETILTDLSNPSKASAARQFFLEHEEEMMEGVRTAWPEAFPYYDLMVTRVTDGANTFATELQNEPMDPSRAAFRNWHTYRYAYRDADLWLEPNNGSPAVRLADCGIFGATDPAMGESAHSDYSAIILLAKAPTGQMFVIVADIQRRTPSEVIELQNKYAQEYPIERWLIEKNAFQAFFSSESARRSMEDNVYLPIDPVNTLANKGLRIGSLQPDLENGYLLLNERGQELLKQQLQEYPMSAHDDGPDALEMARTVAKMWSGEGAAETLQTDTHTFMAKPGSRRFAPLAKDPFAYYDRLADRRLVELGLKDEEDLRREVFIPVMMA